jgi:hypothetical protein
VTNWKTKVIARDFGAATIGRYAPTHNIDALLCPANEVFATSGMDAPVREVAEGGVGLGRLPKRIGCRDTPPSSQPNLGLPRPSTCRVTSTATPAGPSRASQGRFRADIDADDFLEAALTKTSSSCRRSSRNGALVRS